MRLYLTIFLCLFSLSCLNEIEDTSNVVEEIQYGILYEPIVPAYDKTQGSERKQEIDPCEIIREYDVYGRTIRILTWCDSVPYVYKGCPEHIRL